MKCLNRPDAGYRIVGFVGTDAELLGKSLINPRVIGMTERTRRDRETRKHRSHRGGHGRAARAVADEQAVAVESGRTGDIEEGASFYERVTGRVSLNMIRPSWLIFTGRGRQARFSELSRTVVHWLVALIGAILSLPIVLLTAVLIKLESRGPVFYKQERVGKNGRPFMLMKFRSMRVDAEQEARFGPARATTRTTRVGRIIRKIRVDEIPQFWNICTAR